MPVKTTLIGFIFGITTSTIGLASRIIGGNPVAAGSYPEVVFVQFSKFKCTGTIVGPEALILAANCLEFGTAGTFTLNGKTHTAEMVPSPEYDPEVMGSLDLAIGKISPRVEGINPAFINKQTPSVGLNLNLLGYGCTVSQGPGLPGTGGNDGILRGGTLPISELKGNNLAFLGSFAVCKGDSGGPSMATQSGKHFVYGVHSAGNMVNKSQDARLDLSKSQTFLANFATSKQIEICGVNSDCTSTPPPPPPAPTCALTANPPTLTLGDEITIQMTIVGQATSASIDGQPVPLASPQLKFKPQIAGLQKAVGIVKGPGGENSCQIPYTVNGVTPPPPPPAPTCSLIASPSQIHLGQSLTLYFKAQGEVNSATLEGTPIHFPEDTRTITPTSIGSFVSRAQVIGNGGTGSCQASYQVDTDAPTPTPYLAVVPTYCGKNSLQETSIASVCFALLQKEQTTARSLLSEALFVTYRDGTKEILPILHRISEGRSTENRQKDRLTLYANGLVNENNQLKLDSRTALATVDISQTGPSKPLHLEGRTVIGQYFIVDSFETP